MSRRTFHRFTVASMADVPLARERYEELVESGHIHPKAKAMFVVLSDGVCGPLSPPQGLTPVDEVEAHAIKRKKA